MHGERNIIAYLITQIEISALFTREEGDVGERTLRKHTMKVHTMLQRGLLDGALVRALASTGLPGDHIASAVLSAIHAHRAEIEEREKSERQGTKER